MIFKCVILAVVAVGFVFGNTFIRSNNNNQYNPGAGDVAYVDYNNDGQPWRFGACNKPVFCDVNRDGQYNATSGDWLFYDYNCDGVYDGNDFRYNDTNGNWGYQQGEPATYEPNGCNGFYNGRTYYDSRGYYTNAWYNGQPLGSTGTFN